MRQLTEAIPQSRLLLVPKQLISQACCLITDPSHTKEVKKTGYHLFPELRRHHSLGRRQERRREILDNDLDQVLNDLTESATLLPHPTEDLETLKGTLDQWASN